MQLITRILEEEEDEEIRINLDDAKQSVARLRTILNRSQIFWAQLAELSQYVIGQSVESVAPRKTMKIDADDVDAIVDGLGSADDQKRNAALAALNQPRRLSERGSAHLLAVAREAMRPDVLYQVGTQLTWAIYHTTFDVAETVARWINIAREDAMSPERFLLEYIYKPDEATCTLMIDALEDAPLKLRKALLWALSGTARYHAQSINPSFGRKLLAVCETGREDDARRLAYKLVGVWPHDHAACAAWLIAQLNQTDNSEQRHVIWQALARQASVDEAARGVALARIQAALPARGALAAWVRLQSVINKTDARSALDRFDVASDIVLNALLDAGRDDDVWDKYHRWLVVLSRVFIEADSERLLRLLLTRYEASLTQDDWTERRILLAVLAACLETMPKAVQQAGRASTRGALEVLLVKGAADANSFTARRHALLGLSYLGKVSVAAVPVLVAGCIDNVDVVRKDVVKAAESFQTVEADVLNALTPYLTGESVVTAQTVAKMLGAIGAHAAYGDNTLRQQIEQALVQAIDDPSSGREVEDGKQAIRLADVFYEALLTVTGLPS